MKWKDDLVYFCGIIAGFITSTLIIIAVILFLPFAMLLGIVCLLFAYGMFKLWVCYLKRRIYKIMNNVRRYNKNDNE